jgi:hypothetical protein
VFAKNHIIEFLRKNQNNKFFRIILRKIENFNEKFQAIKVEKTDESDKKIVKVKKEEEIVSDNQRNILISAKPENEDFKSQPKMTMEILDSESVKKEEEIMKSENKNSLFTINPEEECLSIPVPKKISGESE